MSEHRHERVGEQFGVPEAVADSVAGDGVAVVPGVADECPTRRPNMETA
jgi:hypothetical protein